MSYKSLLFCPDETTARLVTQVLSELEFTVELSFEPFVTVKKLNEEHFDALVVDCNDEKNASVLFKGARDSSINHSSLCVAVVEGQAGLAKAFRIGANLVLTKPINIEQSKNTLRVAKGLLRKNAPAKAPQDATVRPDPGLASPAPSVLGSLNAPVLPSPAPIASISASSGFSSLEVEKEKTPEPAAEDAAMLESMSHLGSPQPASKPADGPMFGHTTRPIGVGTSGQAAAPALAPEKPNQESETKNVVEIKSAAPLASQDPIFAPSPNIQRAEKAEAAAPVFSAYPPAPSAAKSGGGKTIAVVVACAVILAAAGYFGWKKFQPMQYLHARIAANRNNIPAQNAQASAAQSEPATGNGSSPVAQPAGLQAENAPASAPLEASTPTGVANPAPEGFPTKERIDINENSGAAEPEITVVPKPKPLQVSNGTVSSMKTKTLQDQPAPPAISISAVSTGDATLSGIVETSAALPKPAPGTLQVSQGVTQGLLIKRVAPIYPPAAIQLRKQGNVELLARIGKTGDITAVKVLSGDAALAKAAVDAVRRWKYRPYLLNSEPVEIETQITVKFNLPQ